MKTKTEAISWLEDAKSDSPFATNRFQTIDEAKTAVRMLYGAGAVLVEVQTGIDAERDESTPRKDYANTLLIRGTEESIERLDDLIRSLKPDELHFYRGEFLWVVWWD